MDVIVLCDADDCDDAMSYAVSVAVKQPIVAGMIVYALMQVDSTLEMPFDHAERMAEELALYECTSAAWVARWGRDARERSIRELVAKLDWMCFEPRHIAQRITNAWREGSDSAHLVAQYRDIMGEC